MPDAAPPTRPSGLTLQLQRWQAAGLITAETAAAIAGWEAERSAGSGLGWPVRLALALGAVLLGAGLLLFVSAHWDALAPGWRFALLLALVLGLHGAAAATAEAFAALAVALHGAGSLALGAGIFLSGQIFHLEAHWPAGLLLWSVGAGLGWWLLRQWPQLALLALLMPAWLASVWFEHCSQLALPSQTTALPPLAGALLLAITYFVAPGAHRSSPPRQVLFWIGGLGLLPAALGWALATAFFVPHQSDLPWSLQLLGWGTALGAPLLLGWRLHGRRFWPLALVVAWMVLDLALRQAAPTALLYAWWGLGGLGLVTWGVQDAQLARINIGTAVLAITVVVFYFAEVMSRLERSLSLVLLGVLFLGGGWALERLRRRLVARARP